MIQPKNVRIAICLYFAVIVLSLISGIHNILELEPRPPLFGLLLILSVIYGLLIALGYAITTGRNWARHLNAVVILISLISLFMT